ncbi:MAG: LppX_LprAFG lipoprotein [Chloroflexi bacterium]|nr:LppX_LprAFG lipoprotein [Chloroflexota bacterium]
MCLRSKFFLMSTVIAVMIGSFSCGGSETNPSKSDTAATQTLPSTPTPSPTPVNPQVLLEQSGQAMESLDSFHFLLEHPSGGTPLLPGLLITSAEGDVVKPDKISVDFGGAFGIVYVESSVVTLGDSSYMTNPLTGKWENVPTEVSPLGFFDPQRGVSAMMFQVTQASLISSDEGTYRLKGSLPAEALAAILGPTIKGVSISVELTIDADSLYLLEAVLDGRVTADEPDGTVRVITLSRFNEPVVIEPPL